MYSYFSQAGAGVGIVAGAGVAIVCARTSLKVWHAAVEVACGACGCNFVCRVGQQAMQCLGLSLSSLLWSMQ
jgi:hypothetical protein